MKIKTLFAALLTMALLSTGYAQTLDKSTAKLNKADPQSRFAAARAVIERMLQEKKVPSVAVAVVKDGKIIWEEGFGWADVERKIVSTANTPYSLASVTKPITATAIMTLSQSGKLNLDTPIEQYLGGLRLQGYGGPTEGVTARRIMAHSAGLPLYGGFYLNGDKPAGTEQTISRHGMVVFPPNTRFEYSNIGMKILDAAIEQVSGQTYGDYLRQHVFQPLGMTRSSLGHDKSWAAKAAVRYEKGRRMSYYLTDHPGSGDVWSSAHDMALFLAFHMGTPLPNQRQILSREAVIEMQRPVSARSATIGANWFVSKGGGIRRIWHGGGQPGVSASVDFFPDQKLGLVLLTNGRNANLYDIKKAIVDEIAPELTPGLQQTKPDFLPTIATPTGKWTGTLSNYEGSEPFMMEFQPDGDIHVYIGDGPPSLLNRKSFDNGALSGTFAGSIKLGQLGDYRYDMLLKLVPVGDEFVGELVASVVNEHTAMMLPSFVRIRREAAATKAGN
jgi:CubicO group peptidase (beta-lactamase class C family)